MTTPARVDFRGPIFKTDAGKAARKAINQLVIDVAKEGVKEVKAELYPGHGKDTGEFRRGIRRKKRGLTSRVYGRDARIARWLEGTSKRNRNTRFKGYHVFTMAARRTDQGAGAMARKTAAAIVRELGG